MDVPYEGLSVEETRAHADSLLQLRQEIVSTLGDIGNTSLLARELDYQRPAAGTLAAHGIISFQPGILRHPDIARFIGVHEAVHIELGKTAIGGFYDTAPGYDDHFHDSLVPAWTNGEIYFDTPVGYIIDKEWVGLYPDRWPDPTSVTLESARETVRNYFALLARGKIHVKEQLGHVSLNHVDPDFLGWGLEMEAPVLDPADSPYSAQHLATLILTGYELADYTFRTAVSNKLRFDPSTLEENYANYVAGSLTGVPLATVGKFASQSKTSTPRAQQLLDMRYPVEEARATVTDYSSLVEFMLQHTHRPKELA